MALTFDPPILEPEVAAIRLDQLGDELAADAAALFGLECLGTMTVGEAVVRIRELRTSQVR
jgi:hypothetical protein